MAFNKTVENVHQLKSIVKIQLSYDLISISASLWTSEEVKDVEINDNRNNL